MLSKEELLAMVNNNGLTTLFSQLTSAALKNALGSLSVALEDDGDDEAKRKKTDALMLNAMGPGAASAAVEYAISQCRKSNKLRGFNFTGNFTHNYQLIKNTNDIGEYNNFSNVLRQFLLPRYAYLNFDNLIDPRHQVDYECGYPRFITPIMYRYMYDRDDVARRVVDIYPDESWAVDPVVREDHETDRPDMPFEEAWKDHCEQHNVLQYLYRMDRLSGVGHYGALLIGIDDGKDLEAPIDEPELLAGMRRSVSKKQRNLLYMRPFDEYLSFVQAYETDVMSPRYGLPKFYNLVFLDMTIDAAGASIGTRLNRRVHWSRVIHVADNLQSSLVFGIPRQQPVFNRLLDLRKIKGGSAEMFWKGAFPGISFEINPQFVADNPQFDTDSLKEEVESYSNGLQRYLRLIGVSAKSLAPQVADPKNHVDILMQAIAAHFGIPTRIFLGSEEGRLASSQDKLTWNTRLKRRIKTFVEPSLIRNYIDRMIAIGVLPPPTKGKYIIDWADLNAATDEDKANLALKWTQALSQYVASGVIHLVRPHDYLTTILGLRPSQAMNIIATVESEGGWKKLLDVDPSQGAGQNGVRKNMTKAEGSEARQSREPTDPEDKKTQST